MTTNVREQVAQSSTEEIELERLQILAREAQLVDEERITYKAITVADSTYTLETGFHTIFCNTVGGKINIGLPVAAERPGWHFQFKKTDTANQVVLIPSGSDSIEGTAGNYTFGSGTRDSILIVSDGTDWWIV